jgi:hypothetical protein
MNTDEESELLAWDLERSALTRRLGDRLPKDRETLRRRFMDEQAQRRLTVCANAVTRRAAKRARAVSFIVALLSLLILTFASLLTFTDGLK